MALSLTTQIILSVAALFVAGALRIAFFRTTKKALRGIQEARKRFVNRLLSAGAWIVAILALVIIWGGDVQNLWVSILGALGFIAIGFFAVWSILSNVIAGVAIMLSKHLDIGDRVTVHPEKTKGRIVDITALYVILEEKNKKTLIPNNQFVQRVVEKRQD